MLVEVTAIRLVLAAVIGPTFNNVRTGTIIMPPPTPSIEPKVPAASPTAMRIANVVIGSDKSIVFLCLSNINWFGKNALEYGCYFCRKQEIDLLHMSRARFSINRLDRNQRWVIRLS
jgi:hypothetical protein